MAKLTLPKDPKELVKALDQEMRAADQECNINLVSWKLIDSYLAGARRFRIMDRWNGDLSIAFESRKGELDLRYEEINSQYLVECGRFMKMDVSPTARKRQETLESLRKSGVANAALVGLASKIPVDRIKRQAVISFVKYGTVGLSHYETGSPFMPDSFEVIPPRQLRGLPAWVDGLENLYGEARKRWVALDWIADRVKTVFKKSLKAYDPVKDLRAVEVPWGSSPPGVSNHDMSEVKSGDSYTLDLEEVVGMNLKKGRKADMTKMGRYFVPLEEIYIYDDTQEFVARYIIKIGEVIVHDEDLEAKGIHQVCPLRVARHTDTGRYFARGFVGPLIPFNDQIEKMLASLFKNIQEMDMFGTLMVTGSMGIDLKKWRTGPRPKVEKYEPDPLNPTAAPFTLQPSNSGTFPQRVAEFILGLTPRLTRQGPYYQGETSGRVDSAAGLGFLFNTGNISMGLPSHGLADAFAGCYSRLLQAAKERMGPGDTIAIALVDDAIAGVVLDPKTGTLQLAQNPLPDPWEISIDVKDRTPRDPDVRKRELLELYGQQLVDYERFWITAYEENLEFPAPPKEIWETWRKAMWQIIILFNDGQTPGTLMFGEHTQEPLIQLRAVQRFMNRIEFALAERPVREAFEKWKEALESMSGQAYPVGLPPPEVAAQLQQQMEAQQPEMAMGGGQLSPFGGE